MELDDRRERARILIVVSIGDSDDELGRMLATLRFWFTKDLVRLGENLNIWGVGTLICCRNMSRGSHASLIIQYLESSLG